MSQLIAAGADVNDRAPSGEEILLFTLYHGSPEIINALLAAGARLPDDDYSVVQAAYLAAANGCEATTRSHRRAPGGSQISHWIRRHSCHPKLDSGR